MAANKTEEEKEKLFNEIIEDISENGSSLYSALKNRLSSATFYEFMDKNEIRLKRYARSTELRAERMAEDILNIADSVGDDLITLPDGREVVNNHVISRDRLRVDSRKWLAAKLYPKKYGEKVDLSSSDGSMTPKVLDLAQLSTEELLLRANATNKLKEK